MSVLTELGDLPEPDLAKVAPHRFRRLGDKVLATSEAGHWAFLSHDEYRDYLKGLGDAHPRFDELRVKGFLGHYLDFERLAAEAMEGSLLSWEGTRRFVLLLERGRQRMDCDVAREAVDFAFTVPGPAVVLEAACEDPAAAWPMARFIARYAAKRSDWNGRRSRVWLRTPNLPAASRAAEMAEHKLGLMLELDAAGKLPAGIAKFPEPRVVLRWIPKARDAAGWVKDLRAAGVGSVMLSPDGVSDVEGFGAFYAAFLDAALSDGPPLREEWAAAALRRLPPEGGRPREERGGPLPGVDVTGELCVAPWGELVAAERALDLPSDERGLYSLGAVGRTAWEELPDKQAVHAILAGAEGDHHPLCAQCAYKPACTVAPSRHQEGQGSFWGHLPTSAACAAAMAALDVIFLRLAETEPREALLGWADSWTLL
ncbi:MAG: hypothetical protein HYZ75_06930 [Elusimicrobia bacterium]|nr:hypothetical protein [Elusimicrobiota bacterium]